MKTAFTKVVGPAAWLPQSNIDTDVIIRIERLTEKKADEIGPYAFEAWRYHADGSENPEFVLNKDGFRGAPVLIAGSNFGCGSSREPAVNALMQIGIRAVIAPSFGDIFYANCFQNGLLPLRYDEAVVTRLGQLSQDPTAQFTVDLERCEVIDPTGEILPFRIDAHRRTMLLEGLDEVRVTLKDAEAIRAWQRQDRIAHPWVWETVETADTGHSVQA